MHSPKKMGRPKRIKEETVLVTVRLVKDHVEAIDEMEAQFNARVIELCPGLDPKDLPAKTRTELVREVFEIGYIETLGEHSKRMEIDAPKLAAILGLFKKLNISKSNTITDVVKKFRESGDVNQLDEIISTLKPLGDELIKKVGLT